MGTDIVALLKTVEQCDPACIIGVSSPGPIGANLGKKISGTLVIYEKLNTTTPT